MHTTLRALIFLRKFARLVSHDTLRLSLRAGGAQNFELLRA
jgi:hypothetical protein